MVTLMFYNDDEQLLQIESESNPFSIGDKVWIDVKNNLPDKWDVKNERFYFLIERIEKQISKYYGNSVIEHIDIYFYGKISKD